MKKFLLALAAGILAVGNAYSTTWSVVGDFNNWDTETSVDMTEVSDNVYSVTMNKLDGGFKFIADKSWGVNIGTLDIQDINGNGDVRCLKGGTDFKAANLENVTITLYPDAPIVVFSGLSSDMGTKLECYLVGDVVGGWNPTKGIKMDEVSKGVFEWTGNIASASYFSFVSNLGANDGDWNFFNNHRYSAAQDGDFLLKAGDEVQLVYPKEGTFYMETSGTYTLSLNIFTNTLTCSEATEQPIIWSVIGAFSDWGGDVDMTKNEDGLYEVTLEELQGEFKFRMDHAWTISRGAGADPNITKAGEYECWNNGQNYNAPEKLQNVKLVMDPDNNKLIVSISTSVINTIDLDNENAVYFNLQGVKVENPENGLYIKVTSGKAEKVIL